MSDRKWQRSSLRRVAEQLAEAGYRISQTTLRRLLEDMKYSLKANVKRSGRIITPRPSAPV